MKYTVHCMTNTGLIGSEDGEFTVFVQNEIGEMVSIAAFIRSASRARQVVADFCEQFGVPLSDVQS